MSDDVFMEAPERAPAAWRSAVPVERPWQWLERGWKDFVRAPTVGLAYGLGFVVLSYGVVFGLILSGRPHLVLPATGGFFILAPLLVAGLYDTSRRLERGHPVGLLTALLAWRAPGQLALMGIVLLLIHLVWIRVALLLYAVAFSGRNPGLEAVVPQLVGSADGLALLVVGTFVGAVLAAISFAVAAVSVPMLVDRETSLADAVLASVATVRANPRAMWLWAALIVVLTGLGIATFFIGLALVVPVVAHATWHAYRDTVGKDMPPTT